MERKQSDIICERCGERMVLLPDTSWSLYDVRTVDAICPNCLHVTQVKTIIVKGEDR